ncbi:MAG: hypothetical protein QOK40_2192 [Miltoncostaeaceae bacterium]|jgi:AcrR family transcriptional regulator|nr:hypothetical protein [Miltoncostaeaceae bacterium]
MSRPRTVEDAVVLDAASRVVVRDGPARLTLARVAAEVGLSAATLVQRFGSKRDLLLAVARRGARTLTEAFDAARAAHRSPLEALQAGLSGLTSPVATPEAMANSVAFLQIDLSDPAFHAEALEAMLRMRERIRELLDEAVAAGELRPADTGRLAGAVQNAYNGALISWAVYREGAIDDWLRTELDTLLAGFR